MMNFLPAGSRVAVRSTKPNSTPMWYTTKKDVDLPNDPKKTTCPIREDRDVLTVVHQGFDLFFLAGQVRVRVSAADMAKMQNVRMMELNYDIHGGNFPAVDGHPSTWLWAYGARESESCWMIPEYNVNVIMERLDRLTEAGATWGCKPYDPAETAKLVGLCVQSIRKEIDATVASAEASRVRAQNELDATPVDADPNAAIKKFEDTIKRIQKSAETKLNRLKNTMGVFGLPDNQFAVASASSTINATRYSMQERARLWVVARDALRAMGTTDGIAAAAAMESGAMPAEIAADMLQDNGQDAVAETVRSAFMGEPETFDLSDVSDDMA